CLVLALPSYLLAQVLAQPAQPPANDKPPTVEVYQDFRNSQPLVPSFYMVGPDQQTTARAEDGGLRITLPAVRDFHHPVAVQATRSRRFTAWRTSAPRTWPTCASRWPTAASRAIPSMPA